ncbi:cytochrome c biogenesis protein CcdA [Candidatus Gracilibacteria bacterium]|nr:cytochrome c biogenesis protein CcdA [Candidatus Gracilibacteria bacterium]
MLRPTIDEEKPVASNPLSPSQEPISPTERHEPGRRGLVAIGIILALAMLVVLSLNSGQRFVTGDANVLVLALPAFIAGVLSFLSPCTLPILPAYFAFTFQAQRQRVVVMSIAFFLGLATTLTMLGASATALSGVLFANKDALTFWGGVVVIIFGIMGILGKGFSGPQIQERPVASLTGSYLYGATFALGWTACVGPILGALLTLLAATSGVAILQGATLAFIYALGLGTPLILLTAFFSRLGSGSSFWRVIRGRGFELKLGNQSIHLHTTSVLSGLLMVIMGYLLASGQLEIISQSATSTPLAQWWVELESQISSWFGL